MTTPISKNMYSKLSLVIAGLTFCSFCSADEIKKEFKFSSSGLTNVECTQLLNEKVITNKNPVPCNRLSKVNFSYLNESGEIKSNGIIVVLDVIAPKVIALTKKLLNTKFTIAKAHPIEKYDGDDRASMDDNNTSAFNGRAITGGSRWSLHAYGAAIDINPLQNPFIDIESDGKANISPSGSAHYAVNRLNQRPGKASRSGMAEDVISIFAEHGFFVWGGNWNYPIDYQHFQVGPRSFVEALISAKKDDAIRLLEQYISMYLTCRGIKSSEQDQIKMRAECIDKVIKDMP
jgi:hypothetical protein